ncbi:MAG TPA: alpha/beta hydrolase [Terriglobales bacterium]|jgi:hypothetical protein
MTYFIDLRADASGGNPVSGADAVVVRTDQERTPNPARPLDPQLIQAVQGRDVLLGTHGFHVNRSDGIDNLSHWNEFLRLPPNGFFLGVLWPGDSRWLPFVDYPLEGNEAIRSGRILADYLGRKFAGVNTLSFTSHSLGARIVLETIRNLRPSFKLKTLTIMAGAIDDTCLVNEYRDAAARMENVSVMASSEDEVLKWAFPAGNTFAGIITRGEPYWHGALGRYGPFPADQPANLWQAPNMPLNWEFGHHSYINCEGPIGHGESGPFPPPQVIPPQGTPQPSTQRNWQQAWAAGFVSTRFP